VTVITAEDSLPDDHGRNPPVIQRLLIPPEDVCTSTSAAPNVSSTRQLAVAIPLLRAPGEIALLLPDGVPRQWYVDLAGAMADGQAEVIEGSLGLPAGLLAAAGYFDHAEGLCCNWEGAIAGELDWQGSDFWGGGCARDVGACAFFLRHTRIILSTRPGRVLRSR
jgi:hypothetical protein